MDQSMGGRGVFVMGLAIAPDLYTGFQAALLSALTISPTYDIQPRVLLV